MEFYENVEYDPLIKFEEQRQSVSEPTISKIFVLEMCFDFTLNFMHIYVPLI